MFLPTRISGTGRIKMGPSEQTLLFTWQLSGRTARAGLRSYHVKIVTTSNLTAT